MKFYALFSICVFYFLNYILSNPIDPVKDFKPAVHRKCNHEKKEYRKNFLAGKYDRKLANTYYNDIQFQSMRIHFDYTYTLPHEEKMIRELVMPPVKRFFENSLSVRRFPGKIRFPKSVSDCQGIPVPKQLQTEGVDTDLVIIVSTYRGMKKFYYEKYYDAGTSWNDFNNGRKGQKSSKEQEDKNSSNNKLIEYLEKYFMRKKKSRSDGLDNIFKNNKNSTAKNNTPPWEINDSPGDIVGWSFNCLQDIYTLRPLAGVMQYVADISPTPRAIEEAIWTTLHELMHVLVMDFDLYGDYIDSEFNKLGYDKTIKLKTRLKDLDKLLEERKDVLNDLLEFANFNSTLFNSQNNTVKVESKSNSTSGSNNFTENKNQDEKNNTNSSSSHQSKETNKTNNADSSIKIQVTNNTESKNQNKNQNQNDSPSKRITQTELGRNKLRKVKTVARDENNLALIELPNNKNTSAPNSNNSTKNSTLNSSSVNTNKSQNNPNIEIKNQSISLNVNLNDTQLNKTLNEIYNTLSGSRGFKTVTLPVVDQFYEVAVPKNINLTVLVTYIENFLDHTKLYIKTPKVVEYGKQHFGCSSLDGVELEHFGGLGSSFSHWSKRILNTEFMIADSYGENYISNFTLGLLEDSGWYKVDYSKSEIVPWGRSKGCEFLEEKCIMKKKKKNSFFSIVAESVNEKDKALATHSNVYDSSFKEEFCTTFDEERCSISHTFRAICGVSTYENIIPQEYQYFDNPNVGGYVNFGDYCPYPLEWMDSSAIAPMGSCRNGIQFRQNLGEKVCENCRCFHSSLVEEKFYKKKTEQIKKDLKNDKANTLEDTRAACYEARCKVGKNGQVELVIIIDDTEIQCPKGGAILSVDGYKGFIECPKVNTVCTGTLDPKGDYTSTSAYNLFSHLSEQLLNILYDFIKQMF